MPRRRKLLEIAAVGVFYYKRLPSHHIDLQHVFIFVLQGRHILDMGMLA